MNEAKSVMGSRERTFLTGVSEFSPSEFVAGGGLGTSQRTLGGEPWATKWLRLVF